jgi:predicted AlkP superfamily phosphohydrolase/phosphomutase
MKILVLGLDGATPEILFADERLTNLRRIMDCGVYGRLQSISSVSIASAWMSMATSQIPASANSGSSPALAIWDQLAQRGKQSIISGVLPGTQPRRIHAAGDEHLHTPDHPGGDVPSGLKDTAPGPAGGHFPDMGNVAITRPEALADEVLSMSRKQWELVRSLLADEEWDYFHFVDDGLDRIQQAFGKDFDQLHPEIESEGHLQDVIAQYYSGLDEQIGAVLETLDNETIVLIVSIYRERSNLSNDQTPQGMFILAAPNCPFSGEYQNARLIDMAPTVLDLAGYEIPQRMQGKSLVAGMEKKDPGDGSEDAEKAVRDRLAGLGYV